MFLISPSLERLFVERIFLSRLRSNDYSWSESSKVSKASAKVQQKNQSTKYWVLNFTKKSFYFFFLLLWSAAKSWALGPVKCLSTKPFCLARVVQFLAPFSRIGIPNCR